MQPELITFDEQASNDLLLMLNEWRRQAASGTFTPSLDGTPVSGVFVCISPEGGIGPFTGTGTLPKGECEIRRVTSPLPPSTDISLENLFTTSLSEKYRQTIYNVLDMDIAEGSYFLAINTRHGMLVAIGGGGSGSSSSDACECSCLDEGDAIVDGIVTSSRWSIKMKQEVFPGEFGSIFFPAGTYEVVLNAEGTAWTLDIGDVLTAADIYGASATATTVMDGTLSMTWELSGPRVSLCVEGEVSDPDSIEEEDDEEEEDAPPPPMGP